MKRQADTRDEDSSAKLNKKMRREIIPSSPKTDGFAKDLEVTTSTLADDHLNEAGHIVGQVFMLWPMSNQTRKLQLKVSSDSLDMVFEGPGLQKLDFVSKDRVMVRLKGGKKEAKKAGSPHTLPFKLVFSNGAIVKFLASERRQEEKIVDLFQEAEDEKRLAEDDWFCPPPEEIDPLVLCSQQAGSSEPSDFAVVSHEPEKPISYVVNPELFNDSIHDRESNQSPVNFIHRIGTDITEVVALSVPKATTPPDLTVQPSASALDPKPPVVSELQRKEKRIKKRDLRYSGGSVGSTSETSSLTEKAEPHGQVRLGKKARKKQAAARAKDEREREKHRPASPYHDPALDLVAGFNSVKGGVYTPIGNVAPGGNYHLVGVVADVGNIKSTRTGDFSQSYALVDPSNTGSQGLTVNIFVSHADKHLLPSPKVDQVLLLRNIKCKEFNGKAQGTGYKDSFQWCGYSPAEGKHFYTITSSAEQITFFTPSATEMEYFVKLADWWRALKEAEEKARLSILDDPSSSSTNHIIIPQRKKRQKLQTISQLEPGTFADCVVELLRIWKDDISSDIYVTDYSENRYLQPHATDTSVLGRRVLKVSLWDGPNAMVDDLELHGLYFLKNMRMKKMEGRTYLEGHMGYDDRGIYKIRVGSDEPNLQALLSRKEECQRNPDYSELQPAEDTSILPEPMQQGHDISSPTKMHTSSPSIVKCLHMDQKRSTLEEVLQNNMCPNKFRVRAHITDYYPRHVEDFVTVKCNECDKILDAGHRLCPECGDLTGKSISTRYQFVLRITDESRGELNVNVCDDDAEKLLIGLGPEAAREDVVALKSRLKPLVGHLEPWHDEFDEVIKVEGPCVDMCLCSWVPENTEGTERVVYRLFGCELPAQYS